MTTPGIGPVGPPPGQTLKLIPDPRSGQKLRDIMVPVDQDVAEAALKEPALAGVDQEPDLFDLLDDSHLLARASKPRRSV